MKKSFIILILLVAVLSAGCTGKSQENSTNSPETKNESIVVELTHLDQINTSLQKGPVLLKIGAEWCEECQNLEPILAQIAADYEGRVTVMSMDIDNSPELADYFGIYVIPDTSVIVGLENGNYIYIQEDGSVSTDRSKAKILKIEGKEVYENVLDLALKKEKVKSK
ncbi:thioredoxin [Methanosarcina sp. Ant1]|nr:thioredoxin [Methanosarcina sp. Ant1]